MCRIHPAASPQYELYIDGATGATHAGWALVVVAKVHDTHRLLGVTGGTVALSPSDPEWVGADRPDNIAAELTALLAAHAFVLQQNTQHPFCIRPDLRLSRIIAQQEATTVAHPRLAQLCRLAGTWNHSRVAYLEVRGHTADPWNELADAVAKFCTLPEAALNFGFHFADLHMLANEQHDLAWDWTNYESPAFQACLPPKFDNTVVQFPEFLAPVQADAPAPAPTPPPAAFQFKIATINVLALEHTAQHHEIGRRQGTRTSRIDAQFHAAGIHAIGLQETRTAPGRFQSDHYHIVASGCQATPAPHLGCELWLHKYLPLSQDAKGKPICIADAKVTVQRSDPRRLLARADFDHCSCAFAVLHAPCLQKSQGDGLHPIDRLRAWWQETAELFRSLSPSTFVWVCIDANASLASQATQYFGLHDAGKTGPQTECFETFLHELELYAPSTFAHFHVGPSTTWSHPSGALHRIDYVLTNHAAFQLTKRTSTMTDYDGSFTHEDHIPVILEAQGWTTLDRGSNRIRWDEEALLDPDICHRFQQALQTLPLPTWEVHPNDHCAIYERQLLALARQFFEQRRKGRRRPTLSPDTLQTIAMKRHILDCGRAMHLMQDQDFKDQLRDIELQVRAKVRQDLNQFFDQLLVQMQNAGLASDFKAMYAAVTRLGGKRHKRPTPARPLPLLVQPDGTCAKSFIEQQQVWMNQFAAIEAGIPCIPADIPKLPAHPPMPVDTQQTASFPTAWQIQAAITKLKRGKVPGPNQLTPSILKAAGPVFAKQFALLTAKAAAHAQEPFTWRGGFLVPLHKGKGPPDDPASYRSIFISDYTGKLYHRAIRTQLEQVWVAKINALQLGSRKGMGTDLAHHLLQAHQAACYAQGVPSAIVFFDLRSAFYSVLRQSLMNLPQDPTLLIQALQRMEVPLEDIAMWIHATGLDNATEGASEHLQHIVRDTMSCTHFHVQQLQEVCCTTRGTRPGDPLGDLLFNMIMRLIIQDCKQWMLTHADCKWMGSPSHTESFALSDDIPPAAFLDLAYVDDVAIALHAQSLDHLLSLIQLATVAMDQATAKRGMKLNFDKGKTEALWCVTGKGSKSLKLKLAEQKGFLHWDHHGQPFCLSVTQSYKHLGTWLQAPPKCARDIQTRAALAKSAWGSLAKPLYSKSYVGLDTKTKAFQALSMSRMLYNAHIWCCASEADWEKWQNHLRKPIGLMVKHTLMGTPPTHMETADLFGMADMLPPIDQMHLARLRYLKRLIQFCPQPLWTCLTAALGTKHSWLEACLQSCTWFRKFYPHHFGPENAQSTMEWIPYVAMDTKWKGRLKAAAQACRRHRRAVAEHHVWQKRFDSLFTACGGILPVAQTVQAETWACDACDKTFASRRALATHAGRAHGYRRVVKYFAIGDVCNACCKWYHSRKRFIEHLTFVPACLDVHQACFPALHDDKVIELDQEDHAHTLNMRLQGWGATKALLPVQRVQGPHLPPAQSQDAADLKHKWSLRMAPAGTAFQNLQGRRTSNPCEAPQVLLFDDDMPAFVFQSPAGPNPGDGRLAAKGLAKLHAQLHIRTLVFVHVFSGFRRQNDLHQILEQRVWGNIHFFVLSIDMCMQKIEGNLACSKAFKFWMDQIASGQICGMGGAPPARPLQLQDCSMMGPPHPIRHMAFGVPEPEAPSMAAVYDWIAPHTVPVGSHYLPRQHWWHRIPRASAISTVGGP